MTTSNLFHNVGTWDRALRALVGLLLLIVGWSLDEPSLVWMRVVGLYPLVTGSIGWSPLYALLRIDTTHSARPPSV